MGIRSGPHQRVSSGVKLSLALGDGQHRG